MIFLHASAKLVLFKVGCIAAMTIGLTSCGLISNQSIYEGVRANEKAKNTGTTPTPAALPNYDQYEKERSILKN